MSHEKSVPLTEEMLFSMHGLDVTLPVQCDFCPKKFHDMKLFDKHMVRHKECRIFSCQLCHNTYKSWGNLVAHRKACHQGEVLSCSDCGQRKYHPHLGPVNFPVGNNPNGCEECGEGFKTIMQLYRHYRTHGIHQFMPTKGRLIRMEHILIANSIEWCLIDMEDQYSSGDETSKNYNISDTIPSNITNRGNHLEAKVRVYKCKWCAETFNNKRRLKNHKCNQSVQIGYRCDCNQIFSELDDISLHIQMNHLDANLTCTICFQKVGEDFLYHFYTSHISKENNEAVTCPICHIVFSQQPALTRHLKLHNPPSRYHKCEKCGQIIPQRQVLEHARQHYGDKLPEKYKKIEQEYKYRETVTKRSFICEYCGREFGKKLSLQLHIRRHTGDRPYSCKLCEKAFYTNQQLTIHIRQHTGERPYACGICQKTFTGPTALYVHRKLHNVSKRYICSYCGKRFFWKSAYMGHIRLHTGERPYKCNICNKTFTLKGKLNLHLKKHASEHAILACSDCGENFSSEAELSAHQDEQCCMTMVTFVQEGPSGEKDTKIIVMNSEDLEQNNIYIDNTEVVHLVVE
ncbi:hypothetical protein L9F63_009666 [Diploptera punctata]|uniref:C2H2-type domain-containing protein n=1 Tax=Diploptera punctata TaxID=6984 RepID=A0AAD8AJ87_DIPPU|nr:hypothetical protein L9F63_009666 [Diploptera punctata]